MGRLVKRNEVPITEGPDTVWIRDRMDYGMEKRIEQASVKITGTDAEGNPEIEAQIGDAELVLYKEFIVRWEGAGFEGQKYSPAHLEQFEPDDPLLLKVGEAIAEIVRKQRAERRPPAKDDGSPNSEATENLSAGTSGLPSGGSESSEDSSPQSST